MEDKTNKKGIIIIIISILSTILLILFLVLFIRKTNLKITKNMENKNNLISREKPKIINKNFKVIDLNNYIKSENLEEKDYNLNLVNENMISIKTNDLYNEYKISDSSIIYENYDYKLTDMHYYDEKANNEYKSKYFIYENKNHNKFIYYDKDGNKQFEREKKLIFLSSNIGYEYSNNELNSKNLINLNTWKKSKEYTIIDYFSDDIILVTDSDNNSNIIDSNFKIKKTLEKNKQYDLLTNKFLLLHNNSDNKVIDFNGNIILDNYSSYHKLNERFAEVCDKSACGIYDFSNKKLIVPLAFKVDYEHNILPSIQEIKIINNWFYIPPVFHIARDKTDIIKGYIYNYDGKMIIDSYRYVEVNNLNYNYYLINEYDSYFDEEQILKLLDYDGNEIINKKIDSYTSTHTTEQPFIGYCENKKCGIKDFEGNNFKDFIYANVGVYNGFYTLTNDNETSIYSYLGEEILEKGEYELKPQFYENGKEGVLVTDKKNKQAFLIVTETK